MLDTVCVCVCMYACVYALTDFLIPLYLSLPPFFLSSFFLAHVASGQHV